MVNFIVWLVVGAVAGWLGGKVMKSNHSLIVNIILGIVGSYVGGFVLTFIPGTQAVESGFSIGHILTATIGAIVVIAVARFIRRA